MHTAARRLFALRSGRGWGLRVSIASSKNPALLVGPSDCAPSRGMAERSVTERRIKRMLELEKEAQSTKGMQEVQKRQRMLTFPETDSELEEEVGQYDDPREHPAFWKMTSDGVLLFERNSRDRYRNLRILLGLRVRVWGHSVNEPEDLVYVEKAVNICRIRHMDMIGDTMNKLLGAYRRADRLSDAAKFLTGGVYFRLFPEPWHWETVLLDMARKGKDEELDALFQAFVAYEDRATRPRRESFYITIRGLAEAGNLEASFRTLQQVPQLLERHHRGLYLPFFRSLAEVGEVPESIQEPLSAMLAEIKPQFDMDSVGEEPRRLFDQVWALASGGAMAEPEGNEEKNEEEKVTEDTKEGA